jgi:hypothetical protein
MVAYHDRRYQPDFVDGRGPFTLTSAGHAERDRWSALESNPTAKREVHSYYRGQKPTQTWHKAVKLAARRLARSDDSATAKDYAEAYEQHLVNVLSTRGPELARRFGEVLPGRR